MMSCHISDPVTQDVRPSLTHNQTPSPATASPISMAKMKLANACSMPTVSTPAAAPRPRTASKSSCARRPAANPVVGRCELLVARGRGGGKCLGQVVVVSTWATGRRAPIRVGMAVSRPTASCVATIMRRSQNPEGIVMVPLRGMKA